MFHVFHNVPRKMGLVEHAKGAWLVDNWEMFHVFQYFLVNKIKEQRTTVDGQSYASSVFDGTLEHYSGVGVLARTAVRKFVFHINVP